MRGRLKVLNFSLGLRKYCQALWKSVLTYKSFYRFRMFFKKTKRNLIRIINRIEGLSKDNFVNNFFLEITRSSTLMRRCSTLMRNNKLIDPQALRIANPLQGGSKNIWSNIDVVFLPIPIFGFHIEMNFLFYWVGNNHCYQKEGTAK